MKSTVLGRAMLATLVLAGLLATLPRPSLAEPRFVALPVIENNAIAPRVVYIENPRFPHVEPGELREIIETAAVLVEEHFGISVQSPGSIPTLER